MRVTKKITTDTLLSRMCSVLARIADFDSYEATKRNYGSGVPTSLISDFVKYDAMSINGEQKGVPFIWHTHWAGTYIHFLNPDFLLSQDNNSWEIWKKDFLHYNDWCSVELNYDWIGDYCNQYWYYDGDSFQQISKNTAQLIWQMFGRGVIARKEESSSVVA